MGNLAAQGVTTHTLSGHVLMPAKAFTCATALPNWTLMGNEAMATNELRPGGGGAGWGRGRGVLFTQQTKGTSPGQGRAGRTRGSGKAHTQENPGGKNKQKQKKTPASTTQVLPTTTTTTTILTPTPTSDKYVRCSQLTVS